ncbi:MAG TPA: hypothetical protein VJ997_03490, partial [Longimicrobiales bacterium]|nr:hypothetical protein [Longimicrobiales bacterium]
MSRALPSRTSLTRRALVGAVSLVLVGCGSRGGSDPSAARLTGDWDYYRMLGAAPNGGFEARRRFG